MVLDHLEARHVQKQVVWTTLKPEPWKKHVVLNHFEARNVEKHLVLDRLEARNVEKHLVLDHKIALVSGGITCCEAGCVCVCQYAFAFLLVYVCMRVCVYVCMYVCNYVIMYVCMYAWMYVCTYVCMYVCVYVCMHVSVFKVWTEEATAWRCVRLCCPLRLTPSYVSFWFLSASPWKHFFWQLHRSGTEALSPALCTEKAASSKSSKARSFFAKDLLVLSYWWKWPRRRSLRSPQSAKTWGWHLRGSSRGMVYSSVPFGSRAPTTHAVVRSSSSTWRVATTCASRWVRMASTRSGRWPKCHPRWRSGTKWFCRAGGKAPFAREYVQTRSLSSAAMSSTCHRPPQRTRVS